MLILKFIFAILLCSIVSAKQRSQVYVDPSTRAIRDPQGRHVLFHGVNAIYKIAPYIPNFKTGEFTPQDSLVQYDMENLQAWGMNMIRLGVMWEAVETSPGVFNTTYLDEVVELINELGKYGIYTMVDNHQDVISRLTCGEGVPDFHVSDVINYNKGELNKCSGNWTDPSFKLLREIDQPCVSIDSYNFTKDENNWPLIKECNENPFFKYYTTSEVMAFFDALYTNKVEIQDKFVNFWSEVTAKLGNNSYVIGFDPINEPALGSLAMTDVTQMASGVFDKTALQPLYARLATEVYGKNNEDYIMYFETAEFPDSGLGFVNKTGFTEPPGGKNNSANHVLNDHTYCCQLSGAACATGEPAKNLSKECYDFHKLRLDTREEDAKALGIPFIVSEFGACLDSPECAREIGQVGDVSDSILAGWAYWQFKIYKDLTTTAGTSSEGFYNQDGSLQDYKVKALARTYVQAAQGTIKSQSFNATTAYFNATFVFDSSIDAPTQIYMNQHYYYQNNSLIQILDEAGNPVPSEIKTSVFNTQHLLTIKNPQDWNGKLIKIEIVHKISLPTWAAILIILSLVGVIAGTIWFMRKKTIDGFHGKENGADLLVDEETD